MRNRHRSRHTKTCQFESLEKREVFSASPLAVPLDQADALVQVAPLSIAGEEVAVSLDEDNVLTVAGTDKSDRITVRESQGGRLIVEDEGREIWRAPRKTKITHVVVEGHGGDDRITIDADVDVTLRGGDGDDRLTGGKGNDVLFGGSGDDHLDGRRGDDVLLGGQGRDRMDGGRGRDSSDRESGERESDVESPLPELTSPVIREGVPPSSVDDSTKGSTENLQRESAKFETSSAIYTRTNYYFNSKTKELIELKGDGPYSVSASGTLRINASTLTANDRFENINAAGLRLVEGNFASKLGGTVEVRNGVLTYYPPSNPSDDEDYFSYKLDYNGTRVLSWVEVRLKDIPPSAENDYIKYVPGKKQAVSAHNGLLGNDIDPGNLTKAGLRVTSARLLTQGAGTIELRGSYLYFTPASGYEGQVEIEYTIQDREGLTDSAIVSLSPIRPPIITPPIDPPIDDPSIDDPPIEAPVLPGWLSFNRTANPLISHELHIDGTHPDADHIAIEEKTYHHVQVSYDPIANAYTKDANDFYIARQTSVAVSYKYLRISSANGESVLVAKGFVSGITYEGSDRDDWFANSSSIPSTVFAGDGDDEIHGGSAADNIDGGRGNDRLYGHGGSDTLRGHDGDDYIEGGEGDDSITGGDGTNSLHGNSGNDYLTGGSGVDVMWGGIGDDAFIGNAGNDLLYGEDGKDRFLGGAGDDQVFGGTGADFIAGGEGDDQLHGENGRDQIQGDAGSDLIYGGNGNDHLLGGDGNDIIEGGNGNDSLYGEAGLDTLLGQAGNDSIWGGAGGDWIYGNGGNDLLFGQDGNDSIHGGKGDDELRGGAGDDLLDGDGGADIQRGGIGNDILIALDGAFDMLYGGKGDDKFRVASKSVIKSR